MKRIIAVGFILLSMAAVAKADVYASTKDDCVASGYDYGVVQTRGPFKGMARCFCNLAAKGANLDNQFTQTLSNVLQHNLTVTQTKGSTVVNLKVVHDAPAAFQPAPNQ